MKIGKYIFGSMWIDFELGIDCYKNIYYSNFHDPKSIVYDTSYANDRISIICNGFEYKAFLPIEFKNIYIM